MSASGMGSKVRGTDARSCPGGPLGLESWLHPRGTSGYPKLSAMPPPIPFSFHLCFNKRGLLPHHATWNATANKTRVLLQVVKHLWALVFSAARMGRHHLLGLLHGATGRLWEGVKVATIGSRRKQANMESGRLDSSSRQPAASQGTLGKNCPSLSLSAQLQNAGIQIIKTGAICQVLATCPALS